MRVAAFADYLRVVRALLDGEAVEYELDGRRHSIAFMQRHLEMITLEPRIPMYVSAFGPRTQRLAGRYGDGVIGGNRTSPPGRAALDSHLRAGAAAERREL